MKLVKNLAFTLFVLALLAAAAWLAIQQKGILDG